MTQQILILHGPNLNLLGKREPDIYGHANLETINSELSARAQKAGVTLGVLQSNNEAELIDAIHTAVSESTQYIIFNPAAFTHTSVALRDAVLAVSIPFIEVHLSNVSAREAFRKQSYFSDIALGVISGFGAESYYMALDVCLKRLSAS